MKTKELTECQKFRHNLRRQQGPDQFSKAHILEMMIRLLGDIKGRELQLDDIVSRLNSGTPQVELLGELEALSHEMMAVNM